MSDEDDHRDDQQIDDSVCRDYLRNVCRRGSRCRYKHPSKVEAQKMGLKKPEYNFCRDYQNSTCRRDNCKYVHCTREEEEYYTAHGSLPDRLQRAVEMGEPINDPLEESDIPVCKDFMKGSCDRGNRCRYRHLTMAQYEHDVERRMRRRAQTDRFGGGGGGRPFDGPPMDMMGPPAAFDNGYGQMKRMRMDVGGGDVGRLNEENMMLRQRLDDMEKKVASLNAANEVLMEQNARLRNAQQVAGAGGGGGMQPLGAAGLQGMQTNPMAQAGMQPMGAGMPAGMGGGMPAGMAGGMAAGMGGSMAAGMGAQQGYGMQGRIM